MDTEERGLRKSGKGAGLKGKKMLAQDQLVPLAKGENY
jgi:hypothetical protein